MKNLILQAVIAAGTLNTPQILMLSGIGPEETLDKFNIPVIKNLPGVGQNLQNHVGVDLSFTLHKELDVPELDWASALDYMLQRDGPLAATGMSQVLQFEYLKRLIRSLRPMNKFFYSFN